ncbi:putative glycosidase CRH2 [Basidiobolus ranarum]|uniref:Glycosidase CRH2 n=1 Tax=Basidiobolus ranarum TaxID=34480 RepID=A0ABR2WK07_9FUNG
MTFKKISMLSLLAYLCSQAAASSSDQCTSKFAPCYYKGVGCDGGQNCFAINCDPAKSYPNSCYPKPLCVNFDDKFSQPSDLVEISKFNGDPYLGPKWMSKWIPNYASIDNGQLVMGMKVTDKIHNKHRYGLGSTVTSVRWIQYGNVTARVKSASVTGGIVTSFIIKNRQGDEIDFEWVGGNPKKVQTNYYYDGHLYYTENGKTAYGHRESFSVGDDTSSEFNDYTIQWEEDFIKWYVNHKVVRTLYKKDTWNATTETYWYPARLAPIQLSIWDANSEGSHTVSWAGGPTDWSNPNVEYKAYFDSITVQCKYNGNQTVPWNPPKILTSTVLASSSSTSSTSGQSTLASATVSSNASTSGSALGSATASEASSSPSSGAITKDVHSTTDDKPSSSSSVQLSSTLLGVLLLLSSSIMN